MSYGPTRNRLASVGDQVARVASLEHLLRPKWVTGRPHDLMDIDALLALHPGKTHGIDSEGTEDAPRETLICSASCANFLMSPDDTQSGIDEEKPMAASLTEEEFSKHVNTIFSVNLDGQDAVDLELVQVKGYMNRPGDAEGMERFSVFFKGPAKPLLSQHTYSLSNEGMGTVDLFLVPIGLDADSGGFRYEAVFNYFKNAR